MTRRFACTSIRTLLILGACLISLPLVGCLPSSEPDNNGGGGECETHDDCASQQGNFCQGGTCIWNDPPLDGGDADDGDTTDASDADAEHECAFDTDCQEGFRCNEDLQCVALADAGDISSQDTDPGDAQVDYDVASGDVSCDAGERFNPITGECVSADGG
jgi:hypothetical protein